MTLPKPLIKVRRSITKNSPTILTIFGVGGLIITAISAGKDTLKAESVLLNAACDNLKSRIDIEDFEQEDLEIEFDLSKEIRSMSILTKAKLTWRCYIPTIVIGAASIACIIGSNTVNKRRNMALAGAYSLATTALKEYQNKVVETIGANKERALRDKLAQDRITNNPVGDDEIIKTGNGETRCYDPLSGRYFFSDIEAIRQARNDLNEQFLRGQFGEFMTVNDVYYGLGLANTKTGDSMGWSLSNDGQLAFNFTSCLDEKGRPCLSIGYHVEPRYIYID